jgi:hypothetical protein
MPDRSSPRNLIGVSGLRSSPWSAPRPTAVSLAQEPEEHYPELAEQSGRSFRYLVDAVEDAARAGIVEGDPLTIAHLLWASTHGLVALHLAGKLTLGRTLEELRNAPPVVLKTP